MNTLRRETAREADVVAVGPEVRDTLPGHVVVVHSLVGQEVEDCTLIPETSILGFVE